MKIVMQPVDRLPSNRSRKDYEGQAADILKKLQALPENTVVLVGEGSYNELNAIAGHLRTTLGKENVVVRAKEQGSEVYELYSTAVAPF